MSYLETWSGRITRMDDEGKTKEEMIKELTGLTELPKYFEDWHEVAGEGIEYGFWYHRASGTFWKLDAEQHDHGTHMKLMDAQNGVYEFSTTFYNGGTWLGEMLDEAIDDEVI